jgi:hypothetical protein
MYAQTYLCIYACKFVCMHVCMYVCTYVFIICIYYMQIFTHAILLASVECLAADRKRQNESSTNGLDWL